MNARTAHRIRNVDSWRDGLYCQCGQRPCIYGAKRDPRPEPSAAQALWAQLSHEHREAFRRSFPAEGYETVADWALECIGMPRVN